MFSQCNNFNIDLSSWNVSSVSDFGQMFIYAWEFNNGGNPLEWNTSGAQKMDWMFFASGLIKISSWDVSNVTDMKVMFYSSIFNQDISSWDVSSVVNMEECLFKTHHLIKIYLHGCF